MTVAQLREALATLPDDATVIVVVNSGFVQVYDIDGVGEPHEGVTEAMRGSLLEGETVGVVYVS